ncbi:hypothetical protein OAZ00_04885, partial [Acidimicrobiia bacterium]|nr:hypothetical protein [Acidimicrobiia bacterium]
FSNLTDSSFNVAWSTALDSEYLNQGDRSVTYTIQLLDGYCFSGSVMSSSTTENNQASFSGLSPVQSYSVRVFATDRAGNTTSTSICDDVYLSDISGPTWSSSDINYTLSTYSLSDEYYQINLDWSDAVDNDEVKRYRIYVNGEEWNSYSSISDSYKEICGHCIAGDPSPNKISSDVLIEVRAEDDSGNLSASSLSITVSFPYVDSQAPVWNSCSGTISNEGLTSATYTWNGSANDDVGIDYYRVNFNWTGDGTDSVSPQEMSGPGSVTLQYYWLQISGNVFVTAVDTSGNETNGCYANITLYDASVPTYSSNTDDYIVTFGPMRNDNTIYANQVEYIDITVPSLGNTRNRNSTNGGYEIRIGQSLGQWGTIGGGNTKRFESIHTSNDSYNFKSGDIRTFHFCHSYHVSVTSTQKNEVCVSKTVTVP